MQGFVREWTYRRLNTNRLSIKDWATKRQLLSGRHRIAADCQSVYSRLAWHEPLF